MHRCHLADRTLVVKAPIVDSGYVAVGPNQNVHAAAVADVDAAAVASTTRPPGAAGLLAGFLLFADRRALGCR